MTFQKTINGYIATVDGNDYFTMGGVFWTNEAGRSIEEDLSKSLSKALREHIRTTEDRYV